MKKPLPIFISIVLLLFIIAIGMGISGVAFFPLRMIDFENYLAGSRMLWSLHNPYGAMEYFAPPWMALFLAPFLLLPLQAASNLWIMIIFLAAFSAGVVSLQWTNGKQPGLMRILFPVCVSIMPAALYCYITGQITPLVGCAILFLPLTVSERYRPSWWLAVLVPLMTIKPHLVVIPLGFCILEIIRLQRWKTLLSVSVGVIIAMAFAFIMDLTWISDFIFALRKGDYFGGKPGLAASGYTGLGDLGIPFWVFLPFMVYLFIRWKQNGISASFLALAITVNFLIMPYSRSYDYVLLILPGAVLIKDFAWRHWFPIALAIISLFIVPFLDVALLTPILLTIGILQKYPLQKSEPLISARP
jgi:hypothetical protein